MKDFWEYLIKEAKRKEKYFKNYLKYAKIIKREAQKIAKDVEGYIFGSILKKNKVPGDIDILLISEEFSDWKKRNETRVRIYNKLKTSWPFEIHLITPEQYKNWYRYFIKKKIKI